MTLQTITRLADGVTKQGLCCHDGGWRSCRLCIRLATCGFVATVTFPHSSQQQQLDSTKSNQSKKGNAAVVRSAVHMLQAGVSVAFASDWPVAELEPLSTVHTAVNSSNFD